MRTHDTSGLFSIALIAIATLSLAGCSTTRSTSGRGAASPAVRQSESGGGPEPLSVAVDIVESAPTKSQSVELSYDGSQIIADPVSFEIRPGGSVTWFTHGTYTFKVHLCTLGHFHWQVQGDSVVTPTHSVTAVAMNQEGTCNENSISLAGP